MVLSMATTKFEGGKGPQHCSDPASENRTQLLMIEISRAYFNAKTDEEDPTYVELPNEMGADPGMWIATTSHVRYTASSRGMAGRIQH